MEFQENRNNFNSLSFTFFFERPGDAYLTRTFKYDNLNNDIKFNGIKNVVRATFDVIKNSQFLSKYREKGRILESGNTSISQVMDRFVQPKKEALVL